MRVMRHLPCPFLFESLILLTSLVALGFFTGCRPAGGPGTAAIEPYPAQVPVAEVAATMPEDAAPPAGMVFLPGGEFLMGKEGYADFSPQHRVRLDPFYIDCCEVTNAQYLEFCEATERRLPEFWGMDVFRSGPAYPDHPVVGVSWIDARAYATWRGCRLPTEAEWEYAARGGLLDANYSHGDEFDSTLYAPGGFVGDAGPLPAGSFPPNGFGLHDMTRNVTEWVYDWYAADYYDNSPEENPKGPWHGSFKVIRGGGWHTGPYCCRIYYRTGLKSNWLDFNVGFRCARYVGESAALRMEEIIGSDGVAPALAEYEHMRSQDPGAYYFDEFELNEMAYRLVQAEQVDAAIEVFKINLTEHPDSYNAHDSLAEAYRLQGDRARAIHHYRQALALYPKCRTSAEALKELESEQE